MRGDRHRRFGKAADIEEARALQRRIGIVERAVSRTGDQQHDRQHDGEHDPYGHQRPAGGERGARRRRVRQRSRRDHAC